MKSPTGLFLFVITCFLILSSYLNLAFHNKYIYEVNGDGISDGVVADVDGDIDAVIADTDLDGEADSVMIDLTIINKKDFTMFNKIKETAFKNFTDEEVNSQLGVNLK
ncbi:hypothetical protein N473_13185 [Pseudoalteromonas luteoviolacea CPMOR-1]|uniref:Uncharacterized protein n=1 Tax=Pseudoalteromonas luteoviolacea CPMOR-1 TaxID=1365248 RepID=A0A167LKP0_9GAMM|nr:hypothetical protein [Pseudoalteromonas luteoviolacea]KZN64740.1 hypothetical protein N473_13185 [Pseudoalteromonas luteoviolacea CPMOR-1]